MGLMQDQFKCMVDVLYDSMNVSLAEVKQETSYMKQNTLPELDGLIS